MFKSWIKRLLVTSTLLAVVCGAVHSDVWSKPSAWTADDLLASPTPYALGHRGYGANLGEDPTRPIENTLDAFHLAFQDGIRVVELDLQWTADGKIAVIHDDFLEDFTCISSLTYDELLARKPQVPLFRAVLNSCRHFANADKLSGIIFAEIKVPIPLCDGANTSAQAAISESELVAAVVADIRRARMEDQVILNSGSPTILRQAALQAPEIKRALSLNILQLLDPAVVQALIGLPVTLIPKNDFGLAWYNVDGIARLPTFSYPGASFVQAFQRFAGISLAVGSRAVSVDKLVLLQAGGAAPALVAALHGAGLKAIIWTIENEQEWNFVAQAGSDGITTNDIALGLTHQAPLPALALTRLAEAGTLPGEGLAVPAFGDQGVRPRLALYPTRGNPSLDGTVRVEFLLPDGEPARLGLVDIAGRVVESRDVGSFGPGRHALTLGQKLSPGMYFVRLSHVQGQAQVKAAVTR